MPAFGLGEPFSSILRVGLGPVQAPQLHCTAIIVTHRNSLPDLVFHKFILSLPPESLYFCEKILSGADEETWPLLRANEG